MSAQHVEPVTVLHVDDEPGLCDVVAAFLEREHDWLSVATAADAESGMRRLQEGNIDCVVSDYDMPETNGLEFLREVRAEFADLPFILYTGKGNEEIASDAISAGVDEYLQKDTSTDQYALLANRIRTLVDRRRARSAAEAADRRYHNLIDTAPAPIILFDAGAAVVYANDAALDFLEAPDYDALKAVQMPDLIDEQQREVALQRFQTLFDRGEAVPEMEFQLEALDGTTKRAVVATAPGTYRGTRVAQAVAHQLPPE